MKEGKHAKQKFQVVELYTVLLLVAFVFMSIGYAQISDIDMIISGQATATAQNGVFIYDVGEAGAGGGAGGGTGGNAAESTVDTYFSTNLGTTVVLGDSVDSTISYNVSLYNNSNDKYVFVGVEEPVVYNNANKVKNECITYSLSENMKAGETIIGYGATNKSLDFTVTFEYKNGVVPNVAADKVLNSLLNFRFRLLPMVTLNGGVATQVVDNKVCDVYPGFEAYNYQFAVDNSESGAYNKVPMKYTLSVDDEVEMSSDISENPLTVELYDLDGNLVSFDNEDEGIEILGDGSTSDLDKYFVRVSWNEKVLNGELDYNSAEFAGKNFKYKINFEGTPTVETSKYLGYTYKKSFVVDITTAPLNFNVNMTEADIFVEGEKASLALVINNSSDVNYDTKYKVSIADTIKFTTSIAGSSVNLSGNGIERTLKAGSSSNDNFTIDFAADINDISRKESFDLKLTLLSPYTKEFVIPVNIRSVLMSADTLSVTKDDVNVTMSFDESWKDRGSFEYSIGENNWQTINHSELNNGTVTKAVSVNGKVYARYKEGSNSYGTAEVLIDNIDKESPNDFELSTDVTTYSVKVSGSTTDKGSDGVKMDYVDISGYQYQIMNESNVVLADWTPTQESNNYIFIGTENDVVLKEVSSTDWKITQGTTYIVSMRAVDLAGNMSEEASVEVTTDTVADSSLKTNIGISYSEEEPTAAEYVIVYFTDNVNDDALTLKYQINATDPNGWLAYDPETGVKVYENSVVYGSLFDKVGQNKNTATATVGNIDRNAPIITSIAENVVISEEERKALIDYFTIEQNGLGEIEGYVFRNKSNGDAVVANTSDLGVGTHVIECIATKETGVFNSDTITIVVEAAGYTLTFYANGSVYTMIEKAKTVQFPDTNPTKDNYLFRAWYYDEALTQVASLGESLNQNINLYAGWRSYVTNKNNGVTKLTYYWEVGSRGESETREYLGTIEYADKKTIYVYEGSSEIESIEIDGTTTTALIYTAPYLECEEYYKEYRDINFISPYIYSEGNQLKFKYAECTMEQLYEDQNIVVDGNVGITIYFKDGSIDKDIIYYDLGAQYVCLAEGTLITLADRTTKVIEDITYEDELLVWDFDKGEFASAKPLWIKKRQVASRYNLLKFDNGAELKTIDQHRIFNKDMGRFTYPMTDETPIGTRTFTDAGIDAKLVSKEEIVERVNYYNIITDYHMNLFANGILTSCRLSNLYKIKDMKYEKDNRKLVTKEEYPNVPEKYFKGLRLAEQPREINRGNDVRHSDDMEGYVQNLINLEKEE